MSIFYGVGVGPGDPELITLRALNVTGECDVVAIPAKKESCRAYDIIRQVMPEIAEKEILELPFPMKMKGEETGRFHKESADTVASLLDQGKDVAFLTIGDPMLYSTWVYICDELRKKDSKYECVSIPGISSVFAAASEVGTAIAMDDEEVHIVPGSADQLEALKLSGTKVFMKTREGFDELLARLRELEAVGKAGVYAVTNCGMDDEKVYEGADSMTENVGYLTTIIVKEIR